MKLKKKYLIESSVLERCVWVRRASFRTLSRIGSLPHRNSRCTEPTARSCGRYSSAMTIWLVLPVMVRVMRRVMLQAQVWVACKAVTSCAQLQASATLDCPSLQTTACHSCGLVLIGCGCCLATRADVVCLTEESADGSACMEEGSSVAGILQQQRSIIHTC